MRPGAVLLLSACAVSASAQDLVLTPDAAVTLDAVAGATHAFAVELGADQFVLSRSSRWARSDT